MPSIVRRLRHQTVHPLGATTAPILRKEDVRAEGGDNLLAEPDNEIRLRIEDDLARNKEIHEHLVRPQTIRVRLAAEPDAVGEFDGVDVAGDEVGAAELVLNLGAAVGLGVDGGLPEALVADGFEHVGEVVAQLGGAKVGEVGDVEFVA